MTPQMTVKRVLFYVTMVMIILFPFVSESYNGEDFVTYTSTMIGIGIFTLISFWGCTKEEFEKITGIDLGEK